MSETQIRKQQRHVRMNKDWQENKTDILIGFLRNEKKKTWHKNGNGQNDESMR